MICLFYRAARGVESIGVEAPGNDTPGKDADQLRIEIRMDGLAPLEQHLGASAYLDPTWLPRRQHVVHHKCRASGAPGVAELLALADVVATNIDGVQVGVVPKPN